MRRRQKDETKRNKRGALAALSIRLGLLTLALWLLGMGALTLGTAQSVLLAMDDAADQLPARFWDGEEALVQAAGEDAVPGELDYLVLTSISNTYAAVGDFNTKFYLAAGVLSPYRDVEVPLQTGVVYWDETGNVIQASGDFVCFRYVTSEVWETRQPAQASGYAWLDLSDEGDSRYDAIRGQYSELFGEFSVLGGGFCDILRLEGWFDGSRFEPVRISGASASDLMTGSGSYGVEDDFTFVRRSLQAEGGLGEAQSTPLGELDAQGRIRWQEICDVAGEIQPGGELVTIYGVNPKMELYDPGGPLTWQGERYHSLLTLLKGQREQLAEYSDYGASRYSLWDTVLFSRAAAYEEPEDGQPVVQALFALRGSPLLIAMEFLRNTYLVTFAAALVAFLLLRRTLKRRLIEPLRAVNGSMAAGRPPMLGCDTTWADTDQLVHGYQQFQQRAQKDHDEAARLGAALAYAKSAEENRRQMVSSIAHELKTPLAVAHSYAEGLKEHIAEDKRDRYLDTILAETERMDGMVLEMLDLSRLEAGRVKLSRSEFSLEKLTREIFGKLQRAAEGKGLQVSLEFPDECLISADEGRMAQVVENFATNAVKYTTPGGHIRVWASRGVGKTVFHMANDCPPLSQEALDKVWDTFYRGDEARTGGGTGLGLAIARKTIELHGGECFARNTDTGVEFGFML